MPEGDPELEDDGMPEDVHPWEDPEDENCAPQDLLRMPQESL